MTLVAEGLSSQPNQGFILEQRATPRYSRFGSGVMIEKPEGCVYLSEREVLALGGLAGALEAYSTPSAEADQDIES